MVYSNKENVNILTSLLVAHGVSYAVVCPGSRNAPIVHNLVTCPDIDCFSVTDERSAGFYALGMAQATLSPVAVCVTSGTALLNLLPAVAEAYYQHVPLVVISADRPPQWIDQLDGQTLPQQDALGRFVRKAVSLPEPHNEEEHWFCNRMVNEALLAARQRGDGPVHINVPLTEPLYEFTVDSLPDERMITYAAPCVDKRLITECAGMFWKASRPMVVVGQSSKEKLIADDFAEISGFAVVLNEALSIGCGACHFDELLCQEQLPDDLVPDFLLYVGDTLVSRRMKQFLRKLPKDVPVWAISEDGAVHDTFKSLCGVIEGHPADAIASLGDLAPMKRRRGTSPFFDRWDELLAETDEKIEDFTPGYSQMAAVKCLEEMLDDDDDFVTHYANSMSVRLANIYACHYVFCNRGVNGIEGSLSTAAGFSLETDQTVYCVLGDLSFFYDSNALWNEELRGNLRILLLNNGGGGIFEKFEGLQGSPARERFVMAKHHASAEGICQSYQVAYRAVHNMEELEEGIYWLQQEQGERPMLLEVFTDSANDAKIMKAYYDRFRG